ncbi:hypothetical protein O6H91_01G120600 [Diphasiastrum complanatum]|uniref:Uncharacterized protein n=2 Tax=Diphasiastrum complanatum TaxID=34168 RepID=A0ACC2EVS1_DIPCM|nr:hypothetical protein O6H91_01G120600 [Diphasiastrum complanatum]KAJ7570456.1 hypothetical protein O6H91_01G120600 [Diphasiastrum complanatum]
MAATAAIHSSLSISTVGCASGKNTSTSVKARKTSMRSLNLFGGLKAQNKLITLGSSESTEQQFAQVRVKCFAKSAKGKGGAAALKCDIASEIFTVVPIMSGLVLIGVALGFVLLRVEAAIEESE